jgi:hypothetical protein
MQMLSVAGTSLWTMKWIGRSGRAGEMTALRVSAACNLEKRANAGSRGLMEGFYHEGLEFALRHGYWF